MSRSRREYFHFNREAVRWHERGVFLRWLWPTLVFGFVLIIGVPALFVPLGMPLYLALTILAYVLAFYFLLCSLLLLAQAHALHRGLSYWDRSMGSWEREQPRGMEQSGPD